MGLSLRQYVYFDLLSVKFGPVSRQKSSTFQELILFLLHFSVYLQEIIKQHDVA